MEKGLAPLGEPLRGCYTDSFAYSTLKDRMPAIITRIIDSLIRRRRDILNAYQSEDIKAVIGHLSCLRYELTTNKPFRALLDDHEDVTIWNEYLKNETNDGKAPKWFYTTWIYAETYTYRRIFEAFQLFNSFRGFDYFLPLKYPQTSSHIHNMEAFHSIFSSKIALKDFLEVFLKMSLWGNQYDSSISSGEINKVDINIQSLVSVQDSFLLINDFPMLQKYLKTHNNSEKNVDIILDNSGFELFTDLYLADFLISSGLTQHVRFHAKCIPWFISDVTLKDLPAFFNCLREYLPELVSKWEAYFKDGMWSIVEDAFWTYPHCFDKLPQQDEKLFGQLSESLLVIFKGDLNYRKVVRDRHWDRTKAFSVVLEGIQSLPILCLRTLKADTVVGLSESQLLSVQEKDPDWMVNGKWGLMSFNATR